MILHLHEILRTRQEDIRTWFLNQWKDLKPSLYLSCDIRHSGNKISIVDTNIFPAGFNNLCKSYSKITANAFREFLDAHYPARKKVLLFAEEHTRNKFYLKNVLALKKLIEESGREVLVGVLGDYLPEESMVLDLEGASLTLNRLHREQDKIICGSFVPDLIISNNDFSEGIPKILQDVSQPITPSPRLGWQRRRKISHFEILKNLAINFGKKFDVDPWILSAETDVVENVDLTNEASLKNLSERTDTLIASIQKKYDEYGIKETPYVYIKNNSGTYGMGLLPVFSGEEVLGLNRKKRNKLLSAKGGVTPESFLIQEGIPTADFYSGYPIEPVMYAVGETVVGGFFRIHESKNELESLNAPGMSFSCLCLHKLDEPHEEIFLDCHAKESVVNLSRFLTHLATLAVAIEAQNVTGENGKHLSGDRS